MSRTQRKFGTKSHYRESKHHRRPRSRNGSSNPRNISFVPVVEHRLWHEMFGTMTPEEICTRINKVWLDPAYEFICRRKE